MIQRELTLLLTHKTGLSSIEVSELQAACIQQIVEQVSRGNSVSFQGFGTFELKEKAERKMFNPTTKEFRTVPARQTVGFRPSSTLKEKIKA